MMHTASDVAKWILRYNNMKAIIDDAEDMSNLKLQKLLYYSQGIFLAMTDKTLFPDDIVAWEHGPVVECVYHEYKSYGRIGITYSDLLEPTEVYTDEEENILMQVYDCFGQYSAWGLRNMTHKETPWLSNKKNHVIPVDVIKNYFEKHYVEED